MPFNTFGFILLTLACVCIALQLHRAHRLAPQIFITLVSLGFYALWNVNDVPVLLGSLAANFAFAEIISRRQGNVRRIRFAGFILANIGLLAWYKFGHVLLASSCTTTQSDCNVYTASIPLGISFFTFQQIAYLTTIYKGSPNLKVRDYAFVVCFFPHLVAGPLVRHSDIVDQLNHPRAFRLKALNIFVGISLFTIGLAKKVLLSDSLFHFAAPLFSLADAGQNLNIGLAWLAANAQGLHIYFDFSAYTDMACGVAIAMGIRLPLNFYSPLKATNMDMFWNRWNISVTSFIRDHVFRPLAGRRMVIWRHLLALPITMLVAGLWHGSSWNYVVWGALHGLIVLYDHAKVLLLRSKRVGSLGKNGSIAACLGWFRTQLLILLLGCIFGTATIAGAWTLLKSMFSLSTTLDVPTISPLLGLFQALPWPAEGLLDVELAEIQMLILVLLGWGLALFAPNSMQLMRAYRPFTDRTRLLTRIPAGKWDPFLRRVATPNIVWFTFLTALLVLCFLQMLANTAVPFNYYKH